LTSAEDMKERIKKLNIEIPGLKLSDEEVDRLSGELGVARKLFCVSGLSSRGLRGEARFPQRNRFVSLPRGWMGCVLRS